jgi:Glycosyltransferase like family
MTVSYVVPVWRADVYERTALPWIQHQIDAYGGELIEISGKSSIFEAQEAGRLQASNRFIFYVHDDVRLLTPMNLGKDLRKAFNRFPRLGLMGPTGKIQKLRVPWWINKGRYVGHYCRRGDENQLVYQYTDRRGCSLFRDVVGDNAHEDWQRSSDRWEQFARAGLVDGFYLVEDRTRLNLPWDTETYGDQWHGYDVDRCFQAHQLGLEVMVSPWLFLHDNAGHAGYKGSDPTRFNGRDQANRRINSEGDRLWLADLDLVNHLVRQKWGLS